MILAKFEIDVLSSYWKNYKANKHRMKQREHEYGNSGLDSSEDIFLQRISIITNAIESIYKEVDEDLKTIIDMRYWFKDGLASDWEVIADRLFISRNKVLKLHNWLIYKTAKRVGWA
ncbi:hypothetical protein J2D69_17805 [Lysinibacillus sphaericus]|nr:MULTISPECIES: hypothetical protein [Lysinibacillus]MBE5084614.1 hypothetical protein [Bacillus thuringiensis]AMO32505.1 hypothetical protein AR327_08715 [Lysinibacillus sphaericus]AMR92394.1 hypothetical protein A1T07_20495 [Lysinibacillus sphaericus]ANA46443.1 hypothetical protein A2J09_13165 [Lysinibacillus sphaericus]EWH32056.1 transcriptional regulator [Lysinibacillus sphaericus CBAM5]